MKEKKIGICVLIVAATLILMKCFITTPISTTDEAHYVATAYRFYQGDALLVDDWSPEQLMGFLLLPFIIVFRLFSNSTDGIILLFRIIYFMIKTLVLIYSLYRLERYSEYGVYGWIGAALFYFASAFNIEALSYNTIPSIMVFLMGIVAITWHNDRREYVLCGFLVAMAVLAQPFLIIGYSFGFLLCMINACRRKGKECVGCLRPVNFGLVSLGASILAILFMIFVFSRTDIDSIIRNFPFILKEPDHTIDGSSFLGGMILKLKNTVYVFLHSYLWIVFIEFLVGVCIVVMRILSKRQKVFVLVAQAISGTCLLLAIIILLTRKSQLIENEIWIAFVGYLIQQLTIYKVKKSDLALFAGVGIYIVCVALGTNTGVHAPNAATVVLAAFSVMLYGGKVGKISLVLENVMKGELLVILGCALYLRIIICWEDTLDLNRYNFRIEQGPLKGTYTTEEVYQYNKTMCEDLELVDMKETDILFCASQTPLAYLYADVEYGTMGTPFFELNYERYEEYLELHPQKEPTIIYYHELEGTREEKLFIEDKLNYFSPILMENRVLLVRR